MKDTLLFGAAARAGGLKVLPPPKPLKAADPVNSEKVEYDEKAIERRQDAIVKKMLSSDSTIMVLIMGGGHNLKDNIKRLSEEVEYVRVVVKAHQKIEKRIESSDSEP